MTDYEDRKTFSAEHRRELAEKGWALPDGSFPIQNCQDLRNAIPALGRTDESKRQRVRAHIRKMAKVHGCELPKSWQEGRARPHAGDVEQRTASGRRSDTASTARRSSSERWPSAGRSTP
jgi:hypothetical protein